MTYLQMVVLLGIVIVGIVWVISTLRRPILVEFTESVGFAIITAVKTAKNEGGTARVYFTKYGIEVSYIPDDDTEDDSSEPVQDRD